MRRHRLSLLAAASVAFALACSENSAGPRQSGARLSPGGPVRRVQPVTAGMGAPEVYLFEISPSGGTVTLGDRFTIDIPPNAVCDPSSSSYGMGHWNEDCKATNNTVKVNARIWANEDRVVVDFSPSLRFVPSAVVTISTYLLADVLAGRVDLAATPGALGKYELLYSPDLGVTKFHEPSALSDPSLKTHIDLVTGFMWRRIKHFSGYVTAQGEPCSPAYEGDPTCSWSDEGGVEGHQ
jgi:hypothetical protein